jgi:hypothetical protein
MSKITGVPIVALGSITPSDLHSPNPLAVEPLTANQILRRFKRKTFFPNDKLREDAKKLSKEQGLQGNDEKGLSPSRRECKINTGSSEGMKNTPKDKLKRGIQKIRVQRFKPIKMEQESDLKDAPQNMEEEFMMSNSPLKRTESPRKAVVTRRGKKYAAHMQLMNLEKAQRERDLNKDDK